MDFLHMLDHISLAHPSVGANTITARPGTLERRRMFLLEMDFQKFLGLEGILLRFCRNLQKGKHVRLNRRHLNPGHRRRCDGSFEYADEGDPYA
jgi:hypothetical protein